MGAYNDSPMATLLLKDEKIPSEILDSALWVSTSSPFHASASTVNFEEENSTDTPFFIKPEHKMEIYNDDYDNCYQQPSRKRRLTTDQVRFLEKSFELENKLEPERKIQLARELGLQPRQVAIWFQNRRARCKSKVLEKEYDKLKASYDKLKADYDNLCKENEDMRNEVDTLTEKLLSRENKRAKLEPSSDHETLPTDSPSKDPIFSPNAVSNPESESAIPCRQEDVSSSDVFDSESLNCNHSLASDFSQDEDAESLSRRSSLLKTSVFPKIEDEFYDDLQPNSCNLGFPIQDQGTWLWQY